MSDMVSTNEADRLLTIAGLDWGSEKVALAAASGRVLRQAVVADRQSPPADRVSMDGIAIRFSDWQTGARAFRIHAFQPAGAQPVALPESAGASCLEIATGAILVPSADTVIPVERLSIRDGVATVAADCEVEHHQNIHPAGADHAVGAALLPAGVALTGVRIAVLASVGMVKPLVARRPRILIAATGDELVSPEKVPLAWQLRMSNGPAVRAAVRNAGYDADLAHWPDDESSLRYGIGQALKQYDVLIFSGGISAGKRDFLHPVCDACGVKFSFLQVRQRPGKPFAFGTHEDRRIFCLPGNPVSALACLHRFVLPFLRTNEGHGSPERQVILDSAFSFPAPLAFYLPVILNGDRALPCPANGSGDWAGPAMADGIIEFPAAYTETPPGTAFRFFPYF